jgi:hypothetical protein
MSDSPGHLPTILHLLLLRGFDVLASLDSCAVWIRQRHKVELACPPVYSISLFLIWRIANSHFAPFASMISRNRFATGPILSASVSGSPVA